jgi:3-methyladenine DNA glycosylase AlkD
VSLLAKAVRAELAAAADSSRAQGMQAYMKSTMPYHGVTMPGLRVISKRVFGEHPPGSCTEWQAEVLGLWRGARFREERYVAMELAAWKRFAECRTPAVLPMFEEMIVTGAWWDHVDGAAHLVGDMLHEYP